MNQYNRQQPDPGMAKMLLKQFYNENKLLVYLMLGITIALFVLGEGFHSLFIVSILYLGGALYKRYLGEQKLLYTLMLGGLSGALVYAAVFSNNLNVNHLFITMIDSAVFAVFVAVGTYSPNFELLFFGVRKIKLKYMVLGFSLLALLFTGEAYNYRLITIAGMLYGFLSVYLKGSNPYKQKSSFKWPSFATKQKGPHIKKNKEQKKQEQARKETDEEYNKRTKKEQEEIDVILDKIKLKGYESLSASEKQKLFEKSK